MGYHGCQPEPEAWRQDSGLRRENGVVSSSLMFSTTIVMLEVAFLRHIGKQGIRKPVIFDRKARLFASYTHNTSCEMDRLRW